MQLSADYAARLQFFDVHPARQHTNTQPVVEGAELAVAVAHAKIRRNGYRRPVLTSTVDTC